MTATLAPAHPAPAAVDERARRGMLGLVRRQATPQLHELEGWPAELVNGAD